MSLKRAPTALKYLSKPARVLVFLTGICASHSATVCQVDEPAGLLADVVLGRSLPRSISLTMEGREEGSPRTVRLRTRFVFQRRMLKPHRW